MTDLTMIGLGAMGSALAQAFLQAGHDITVWNRTANKMNPLVKIGASPAGSIVNALQASPIIVICIDNYDSSKILISKYNVEHHLSGKVLIQLSTGTPKEANEFAQWISAFDCEYLDGAIMPYPDGIGAEEAKILFAGGEDTYQHCKSFLDCLGGDLRYLGSNIGAAAALDMAILTHDLCSYLGAIHGAHICEAENISVDTFAAMFPEGHPAKDPAQVIHSGKFDNPGATITVWDGALQRIQRQAQDAEINSEVPDFISSLFKRAKTMGLGEEDVAALIKVMRKNGAA